MKNLNIFSEDHWPLYALFSHVLNCSCVDLVNHWSDSSSEVTAEGSVMVLSARVALAGGWYRTGSGNASISSAYPILGKSQNLLFLWYLEEIQAWEDFYLLKLTPNCKRCWELIDWFITRSLSQAEQNAPVIKTVHTFPLDHNIWESKWQGQTSVFQKHCDSCAG